MTDNTSANIINNMLRSLSTWMLDFPAYWLLKIMYKIFFNVSTAELFTSATIKNFYSRVQLIIGVFMVFKLAVTILKGIVNPDEFTDKKSGFYSVITRIITSLIMLTLLVPINIPNAKNNYEKQLNNNGLLFGTLYSLQYRLLDNNTLGRLILGTTDNATTGSSNTKKKFNADTQAAQLEKSANIFTTTILKGFIRINLVEENADETKSSNWVCQNVDENILEIYTKLDADPADILGLVNTTCDEAEQTSTYVGKLINKVKGLYKGITGSARYMFAYIPILPAIVGFVFVFILLGFTVDIAVRAVKLAVLRLIAPIPIISYIDPKQAKDGAFPAWCKTLVSTYLDLFLRLAVVYFVIFLIQDMIVNGIIINNGSGIIGILSSIFIWIGLFFFAKQAPKFIKDVLGIKGSMQNIGLSAILGGTASLLGGGGIYGAASAAMQGAENSAQAYNNGKTFSPMQGWSNGSDLAAQITTGDPKAKGGVANHLNDYLLRKAGVNSAWSRYGVSQHGLDQEKSRVQDLESKYSDLQDEYSRFTNNNMSEAEKNRIADRYRVARDDQDAIRESLYRDMGEIGIKAKKARKSYDEVKKFADAHRISPSTEEKYRRSYRERIPGSNSQSERPDFYEDGNFVARRTEHRTMRERVTGVPNEPNADGRDGLRWRPGSDSTDTNQIHDNPNSNIDSVGNSGPGGPAGMPPI